MDTNPPLVAAVNKILKEVVTGPIIVEGKISLSKLTKPR